MRLSRTLPFLAVVFHTILAAAAPTYEPIANFESGPIEPERARLIRLSDGFFYGVSRGGGGNGAGVIYRVAADGTIATLADFPPTGGLHKGALVSDGRGFLWGTTYSGGAERWGAIYKYELATGTLSMVIQFKASEVAVKGGSPFAGLVADGVGYLWGTTNQGGAANVGTVFKLNPITGVLRTVAEFTGTAGSVPGANPMGGMVRDGAGFLWGTTSNGGPFSGTVFKVNISTGIVTNVANFDGLNGGGPESELVADGSGFLWGTAHFNGSNSAGTIFKVRIATGELTKVVDFTGTLGVAPGSAPAAGLVRDRAGLLWGTTTMGGSDNAGTVFKIHPGTGVFTSVMEFPASVTPDQGFSPDSTLAADGAGKLWGTTRYGGMQDRGTLFRVDPVSGQTTTIREFTGAADGIGPIGAGAGVSEGAGGMLWGTTYLGGPKNYGTIYIANPTTGQLRAIHQFTGASGPVRGAFPRSTLRKDGTGFFWGTTVGGGASNLGTVFKINIQTGAFTSVAEFGGTSASPGTAAGSYPEGDVVQDGLGNVWGTTQTGGTANKGTIFKINTRTGQLVTVVNFTGQEGAAPGHQPEAGLCLDGAGFLWGTALFGGTESGGVVFKVHIGTGGFTSVASFTGPTGAIIGRNPRASLVRDGAGFLWGTTSGGGPDFEGTIFKVNIATGALSTVLSFTYPNGAAPGSEPYAGLVSDGAGSFWGTTANGGPNVCGTIFKISTGGAFTNAFVFTGSGGAVPGCYPTSGYLLRHSDGHLYGVAGGGGVRADGSPSGGGQIFRVRLANP